MNSMGRRALLRSSGERFFCFPQIESRLSRVFLFIFEGLGTSELMLILIVALVIFGPRKLPQLSRSIGKSLANFRRASEDFKQTWEREVSRESAIKEALIGESMLPDEDRSILGESRHRTQAVLEASNMDASNEAVAASPSSLDTTGDSPALEATTPPAAPEVSRTRKRDWL
jgi:TatA/E family protein of Tat protein translocase